MLAAMLFVTTPMNSESITKAAMIMKLTKYNVAEMGFGVDTHISPVTALPSSS
jgi:hypothetical protein